MAANTEASSRDVRLCTHCPPEETQPDGGPKNSCHVLYDGDQKGSDTTIRSCDIILFLLRQKSRALYTVT